MPIHVFSRAVSPRVRPSRRWLTRATGALLVSGTVLLGSTVPVGATELPVSRSDRPGSSSTFQHMLQAVSELAARLDLHDGGLVEQVRRANAAKERDVTDRNTVTARPVLPSDAPLIAAVEPAPRDGKAEPPAKRAETKKKGKPACRNAGDGEVPEVVAAIFRCHLRRAGFNEQEVGQWTAEAVVVSKCESYWDPNIVVFDGRYLHSAHPATGYRYSAAGVFQFIRKTADKWIDGGYAKVKDPRANIDAAARLFIHNRKSGLRGWEDWACAAANDGFKQTSVLPNYPGGPPSLPDWAWEY